MCLNTFALLLPHDRCRFDPLPFHRLCCVVLCCICHSPYTTKSHFSFYTLYRWHTSQMPPLPNTERTPMILTPPWPKYTSADRSRPPSMVPPLPTTQEGSSPTPPWKILVTTTVSRSWDGGTMTWRTRGTGLCVIRGVSIGERWDFFGWRWDEIY